MASPPWRPKGPGVRVPEQSQAHSELPRALGPAQPSRTCLLPRLGWWRWQPPANNNGWWWDCRTGRAGWAGPWRACVPGATPLSVSRSCPISPTCSSSAGSQAPGQAEASRPPCSGAAWRGQPLRWVQGQAGAAEGTPGKRMGFLPQQEGHRQGPTLRENRSSRPYPKVNLTVLGGGVAAVGYPQPLPSLTALTRHRHSRR